MKCGKRKRLTVRVPHPEMVILVPTAGAAASDDGRATGFTASFSVSGLSNYPPTNDTKQQKQPASKSITAVDGERWETQCDFGFCFSFLSYFVFVTSTRAMSWMGYMSELYDGCFSCLVTPRFCSLPSVL